jgi:hypothetical protein
MKLARPGRTTRLSVVVGEPHTLRRQFIEIGGLAGHDALVVRTDIEPADIVTHDDNDVWLFLCG